MRGSMDDRKDRTVGAKDPSESHAAGFDQGSRVGGQTILHILPVLPDGENQDSHEERKLSSDTTISQTSQTSGQCIQKVRQVSNALLLTFLSIRTIYSVTFHLTTHY